MKLKLIIYTLNKKKRKTLKGLKKDLIAKESLCMFAIQTGCTNEVEQEDFLAEVLRVYAKKRRKSVPPLNLSIHYKKRRGSKMTKWNKPLLY